MIDSYALNPFSARDVLERFGIASDSHGRGPCPLCGTSNSSSAFSTRGIFFKCFACNKHGTQVALFARLAGIDKGAAMREIAGILGLVDSDPAESARKAEARKAEAARLAKARAVTASCLTAIAAFAYTAERHADAMRELALRTRNHDLLAIAYHAEDGVRILDELLA